MDGLGIFDDAPGEIDPVYMIFLGFVAFEFKGVQFLHDFLPKFNQLLQGVGGLILIKAVGLAHDNFQILFLAGFKLPRLYVDRFTDIRIVILAYMLEHYFICRNVRSVKLFLSKLLICLFSKKCLMLLRS